MTKVLGKVLTGKKNRILWTQSTNEALQYSRSHAAPSMNKFWNLHSRAGHLLEWTFMWWSIPCRDHWFRVITLSLQMNYLHDILYVIFGQFPKISFCKNVRIKFLSLRTFCGCILETSINRYAAFSL